MQKMDYNGIKADIGPKGQNLILSWFQFHKKPELFRHIVDIIINRTKQQQLSQFDHESLQYYESYMSSDKDSDEAPEALPIHKRIDDDVSNAHPETELWHADYYYSDIELDLEIDTDDSYKFDSVIGNITVSFSIFELIVSLQSMSLSTTSSIWQKIGKNEDDLIGDKQNLCLCIHILICVSIQNKYKSSASNGMKGCNDFNKFQTDPSYLTFLDNLSSSLCQFFLNRSIRKKVAPDCLPLVENKSHSLVVMGFGDLVEELPKWLSACNEKLLNPTPSATD